MGMMSSMGIRRGGRLMAMGRNGAWMEWQPVQEGGGRGGGDVAISATSVVAPAVRGGPTVTVGGSENSGGVKIRTERQ